ncbi:flagellar hook-length control protein FliK [Sphingomonas sp.]|uniref:flagellar hook-length control protein FliK n=1 Tax=Sphingomonas sp. TaxID=28214 RepID=UPI003B3A9DE8
MADVALAVGGPAAVPFPAVATMPAPGVAESAELAPADPFGALFATLAAPVMAPAVMPSTAPSPIAIPQILGEVPVAETTPLLFTSEDAPAEAETDDALESAIAAGPTAILALALAPPPTPVATPVTKAPEETGQSRRAQLLAGSAAIASPGATLPDQTNATPPPIKSSPAVSPRQDAGEQLEADTPILPDVLKPFLAETKQWPKSQRLPDAPPQHGPSSAAVFQTDKPAAHLPQTSEAKAPQIDSGRPAPVPAAFVLDASPRTDVTAVGLEQRLGSDMAEPGIGIAPAAPAADIGIARQLVIARDGLWLDTLARDITHAAGSGSGSGTMNFTLSPPHLGTLAVAIATTDDGAAIRLTADTQATHDILADHQPQLVAEARAHGLKIADAQVDLRPDNTSYNSPRSDQGQAQTQSHGQGQANAQSGQHRQSSTAHQPFSRSPADEPGSDPAASGQPDALYA